MAYYMINTELACDLNGVVGGAIVYDKRFKNINTRYRTRHIAHHKGQAGLLVIAGYLHNHFHEADSPPGWHFTP